MKSPPGPCMKCTFCTDTGQRLLSTPKRQTASFEKNHLRNERFAINSSVPSAIFPGPLLKRKCGCRFSYAEFFFLSRECRRCLYADQGRLQRLRPIASVFP